MISYPLISIIFPNFNGGKEPLDCLFSIEKLAYPKDKLEIIVVDNNSQDDSDSRIQKKYPQVKLWKMKKNLGFARAINTGIKHAHGTYIFIGNDDLVLEKRSLKIMINYLLNHKNVGIVGGKIFYKYQPQKIASTGYMMNKWTGNIYRAPNPNKIKEPDWVQGCAILTRKIILNKIGNLDPDYFLSFDDYDLCVRIKNAGFKVIYLPQAIFWHGECLTVDKNKPHKNYHWYKSKFRFIIKHLPLINVLSILFIQILIVTPYRALILRDKTFFPTIKAFWWNIKNLCHTQRAKKGV